MNLAISRLHVVIPARYNSRRLPGKPLVDLAGKPMVVRVYDKVRAALPDSQIVVAVDDERVLKVLQHHGASTTMTDPAHQSGTDRCAEVARHQLWADDDIVINVQGDEPLVPTDMLQAFAKFCNDRTNFCMGTIAAPISSRSQIRDPNVVKVIRDIDGRAINFSRAPIPYARDLTEADWPVENYLHHVGVYAYRNATLHTLTETPPCALENIEMLEQLRALWLGIQIDVMLWPHEPPGGVDTADDVQRVAKIFDDDTAHRCYAAREA